MLKRLAKIAKRNMIEQMFTILWFHLDEKKTIFINEKLENTYP